MSGIGKTKVGAPCHEVICPFRKGTEGRSFGRVGDGYFSGWLVAGVIDGRLAQVALHEKEPVQPSWVWACNGVYFFKGILGPPIAAETPCWFGLLCLV